MPNPFLNWSQQQVDAHNARVAGKTADERGLTQIPKPEVTDSSSANLRSSASICGSTRQFVIATDPCPAPRMTRRDKWLKPRRTCVQRYFDYREVLQRAVGDLPIVPDEVNAVFHFTMPESWSQKRRAAMDGQPHRQRPDGDNCTKAVQDALFLEDGGVWRGAFEKRWARQGSVEITMVWAGENPGCISRLRT